MSDESTLVKENLFLRLNAALSLHCFENPFQVLSDKRNKIPNKIFKDGLHRDRDFIYLDPGENFEKDISKIFALIWRFKSYSTWHMMQCREFHKQRQRHNKG